MAETRSTGIAKRFWSVAMVAGTALLLIAGGFAANVFFIHPGGATGSSGTSGGSQTFSSSLSPSTIKSSSASSTITRTSSPASSATSTALTSSTTSSNLSSVRLGSVQIILPLDVGNDESLNFQPAKIKVVVGVNNTIVWVDEDYIQHTIRSVNVPAGGKAWDSGILNEGQSFTQVLTVPGNYKYFCTIHPDWMIGTIEVVHG
jgi:plastocyanin